ncbi:MAG: response regulator [Synoicihabitans sp.]
MTPPPFLSTSGRDGIVLIVDDVEKNLQVVGELLTNQRYEVMFAASGQAALDRVAARKPDLILLDIMMPEMDGIEVCRRLQLDPSNQNIPIIFLTAANDDETAVKGLTEGAVDYITKPFNTAELLARVSTHVALKQSRDEARRVIREKNDLMSAVAHDLKNPLASIRIAARSLQSDLDGDPKSEMAAIISDSCEELLSLIEERLTKNAREAALMQLNVDAIDLREILTAVVQQNRPLAHEKKITLELALSGNDPIKALADYHAAAQIFDNLVSNALKFSPTGKSVVIELGGAESPEFVAIKVRDHGPGVSAEDRDKLFQPYQRLSAQPTAGESSTGLGLSITQDLVKRQGGRIGVEDTYEGGATFIVELPTTAL